MFDIGWSELVLIGVVALIVIGPKELPAVLRAVGQWTAKIRRMAAEFQGQFQDALREAELADLKKQVDEINDSARSIGRFDPLAHDAGKAQSSPSIEPAKATGSSHSAANGAEASPEPPAPPALEAPQSIAPPPDVPNAPPSAASENESGKRPA